MQNCLWLIVIYCEVEEDLRFGSSTTTRRRMADFKNSKLASAFEVKVEGCLRYLTWTHYPVKHLSKVPLSESSQKEPASK